MLYATNSFRKNGVAVKLLQFEPLADREPPYASDQINHRLKKVIRGKKGL